MDAQARFAQQLFDTLWESYESKVPYARVFENLVRDAGGAFVNDHVAFRTLHLPELGLGLRRISRVFEALGYQVQEDEPLAFPDQHLEAFSFLHHSPDLPKVFVSELKVEDLPGATADILRRCAESWRVGLLPQEDMAGLSLLSSLTMEKRDGLLRRLRSFFEESPWRDLPTEANVLRANEDSQYGAWVMLFGNSVNHFTGSVNAIGAGPLGDIEAVANAMRAKGVPMKEEIEGAPGTKLRQTSTQAVRVPVKVRVCSGRTTEIGWPYAYFEIAQRGIDQATGKLFTKFLGPQASKLFDMTRAQGPGPIKGKV